LTNPEDNVVDSEFRNCRARLAELESQLISAKKTISALKGSNPGQTKLYDHRTVAALIQQAYILGLRREDCDDGRLERLLDAAAPKGQLP